MISLRGIRSYQIGNGLSTKQYQYCVVADKENLLPITLLLTFRIFGALLHLQYRFSLAVYGLLYSQSVHVHTCTCEYQRLCPQRLRIPVYELAMRLIDESLRK